MATNAKELVRFNIKNAKYALQKDSDGTFESPVSFGYSDSISLEADYAEKVLYGDGKKILTIPNDKGKTGTLTLLTVDEAYEIAMGRRMKIAGGTAEIKQRSSVTHAIYFEFDYMDESGNQKTAKTIVYGVTSGRPSQTFSQTTDDINNNNTDYSLTIKGITLQDSTGKPYKDAAGNVVTAWQVTSIPGDSGYEEFGVNISAPKATSVDL